MDEDRIRRIFREELENAFQRLTAQGRPGPLLASPAHLNVDQAAKVAQRHRQTIADALRTGALHGSQRVRRGTWTVRRDCLEAWLEKRPCEHQKTS